MSDQDEFDQKLASLFSKHGATSYQELAGKLGLSRSAVGNWVNRRSIPDRYLLAPAPTKERPWQLPAACTVLRNDQMTDAEARKVALSFLEQLEAAHG